MALSTRTPKGEVLPPTLTLSDLREALFNGEAQRRTDLDVLEEMAKDKRGLVNKVVKNKQLIKRAGNPDALLHQLDTLHEKYRGQIKTIEAARGFDKKVEKQGWGSWALEKVKSVVLFPVRHPVITVLILAAIAAGIGFLYYGLGEALLRLIPNYASKVVEVAKKGVQALSESMTQAAHAIHSGKIPFAGGIGSTPPVAPPTLPPGVPAPVPGIPLPPVPGGTVPVPPTIPPDLSPIGRELL